MPPNVLRPPALPRQAREETLRLVRAAGVTDAVALLGVRGYYRDTMGTPGVNDRGLYDDAIFLVSPEAHVAFTANTDPSVFRPGIASLVPGVWRYKIGTHGLSRPKPQRYPALVQAAPVTVARDGGARETGWFGINIHRGSRHSTSSEGCQTIWPEQWEAFMACVRAELKRAGQPAIPYVLLESAP